MRTKPNWLGEVAQSPPQYCLFDIAYSERMVDMPNTTLWRLERCTWKATPRGCHQSICNPGPLVDTDRCIPQLHERAIQGQSILSPKILGNVSEAHRVPNKRLFTKSTAESKKTSGSGFANWVSAQTQTKDSSSNKCGVSFGFASRMSYALY